MSSGSTASDFLGDDMGGAYGPLFDFEGFYSGVTIGAGSFPAPGLVGTTGVVVGANFSLTDAFISGVEFQGDLLWNDTGLVGYDALFLGKLGGYLADNMMVYGAAGGGFVDGTGSYAMGAGVEMAVTDQFSVRGEALGTGTWGDLPNGAKGTLGVLWHMN